MEAYTENTNFLRDVETGILYRQIGHVKHSGKELNLHVKEIEHKVNCYEDLLSSLKQVVTFIEGLCGDRICAEAHYPEMKHHYAIITKAEENKN